jgi:hypothetical protein
MNDNTKKYVVGGGIILGAFLLLTKSGGNSAGGAGDNGQSFQLALASINAQPIQNAQYFDYLKNESNNRASVSTANNDTFLGLVNLDKTLKYNLANLSTGLETAKIAGNVATTQIIYDNKNLVDTNKTALAINQVKSNTEQNIAAMNNTTARMTNASDNFTARQISAGNNSTTIAVNDSNNKTAVAINTSNNETTRITASEQNALQKFITEVNANVAQFLQVNSSNLARDLSVNDLIMQDKINSNSMQKNQTDLAIAQTGADVQRLGITGQTMASIIQSQSQAQKSSGGTGNTILKGVEYLGRAVAAYYTAGASEVAINAGKMASGGGAGGSIAS